ncbi:MAG TPA: HEAT repeat domain-containing protein [Candidatus Acidoferrales bacterium]|nr:HEAT repeat domain-containing protein [Candidatus Acidoferrales bacterium]
MSDESETGIGSQPASFRAHRDAENLDDAALIPVAAAMLQAEKSAQRKRHLLFVLGHLGAKANAAEVEAVAMPVLANEKNGYTLAAVLGALRRLPRLQDAAPVRALLKSRNGQVREAAILALRGDRSGEGERDLLALIKRTQNRFELTYAVQTLGEIGCAASIPALGAMIHNRNVDVKCAAITALANVGGKAEQAMFLDALGDKNPAAKAAAIFALQRHGDARAVPKVAARIKTLLRKPRALEITPSDLAAGLEFLGRHRGLPEARDAIEEAKRSTTLFPAEERWVRSHFLNSPRR